MTKLVRLLAAAALLAAAGGAGATGPTEHWVAAWTGSAQGPYPSGFASAQPVLSFAFPAAASGAHDQSFRLIVRPDLWGPVARLRFSNAYGTRPLALDAVHAGLQQSGAAVLPGTNRAVSFGGLPGVDHPARRGGVERPGDARSRAGRRAARGQLPRGRRQRADDLARQGADHLLPVASGRRRGAGGG